MAINLSNAHSGTFNLTNAGVVCVAAATTTTTGAASAVAIKGRLWALSAATGAATPTVDASTGAAFVPLKPSQACLLVYGVNAATGTAALGLCQGKVVDNRGAGTELPLPVIPDNFCPIAYVPVQTASNLSGTWTPASNNWTGVTGETTGTVVNIFALPASAVTL
jgi:hypothetical protein